MKDTKTQAAAAPFNMMAPWAFAGDQGRQQMAVATESACAMFRGFEAMRKVQERAAHQALQSHSAAAAKLKGPCAPADLMSIQSNLLRANMQGATQYWQELAATAMEMQAQLMDCGSHLINSDAMLEAAAATETFPDPGLNGFFAKAPARAQNHTRASASRARAST